MTVDERGNDPGPEVNLTVTVEDFGPIGEGSVELRPLTVFVGPSNTGKSYLAILLYALHRHFRSAMWERPRWPSRADRSRKSHQIGGLTDALEAMLRDAESETVRERVAGEDARASLPGPIAAWVREALIDSGPSLAAEVERCFGTEWGELVRNTRNVARIGLRSRAAGTSRADGVIEHELAITNHSLELTASVPEGMTVALPRQVWDFQHWIRRRELMIRETGPDGEPTWWQLRQLLAVVGDRVLDQTLGPLRLPAFYLPADRTGIMHAHQVVVGALIENATMAGLRRTGPTPTLSGVLADFLQHLIEIDRRRPGRRRFHLELGRSIEERILQGSVRIERDGTGYPSFRYRPSDSDGDLPLMRASSTVAELAPLVLYLRHVVATDNVLIVEEPESHLHPAMQVELVGQFAKLAQAGIRVLVTTHSEWVLDELANIVRLSELPEKERGGISDSETALTPDQVGAWLFELRGGADGSAIKELPLDETGYARTGIEEVAMGLHNRFATIRDRIEERR